MEIITKLLCKFFVLSEAKPYKKFAGNFVIV